MAVDTAAKRRSALVIPFGGTPLPSAPVPAEEILAADRATLSGVYAGNALGPPAIVIVTATTPAQLRALVESSDLAIDWSMALYDSTEAYVADITADMTGGTITRNLFRTLHGTAKFRLSRRLLWGSQRLAPSVTLTSTAENLTATWAMGRWLTSIPQRVVGAVPESYEVEAYDKLMLLDTPVGRSYAVAAGTSFITAVETILGTELGETSYALDQAEVATTLTAPMNWLLDDTTTWLRIVNDLLSAIGYEGLWVDRDGRFRSRPYVSPGERGTAWFFDADDPTSTIVGDTRTVIPARSGESVSDPIDTPNQFTFVNGDIAQSPPVVGDGIYTVTNNNSGPTSVTARGRNIPTTISVIAISGQGVLVQTGNAVALWQQLKFRTTLELETGPCPPLWHFDVIDLIDSALGPHQRWAVEEWELDLVTGDMKQRWRSVQAVG